MYFTNFNFHRGHVRSNNDCRRFGFNSKNKSYFIVWEQQRVVLIKMFESTKTHTHARIAVVIVRMLCNLLFNYMYKNNACNYERQVLTVKRAEKGKSIN